jgi:hypothetical protein
MLARTDLTTLAGSAPDQRVQVSLIQRRDGRVAIALCEQHYADGIGWFDQRTLSLDPRQLRQLSAVLNLNGSRLAEYESEAPAIVPFPVPSTSEPYRPAVGEEP